MFERWVAPALLAVLLAAPACGGGQRKAGPPGRRIAMTLSLVDGGELTVPRRTTVLHFFTTWSLASQSDVAELVSLHRAYGAEIDIIGVGLDPDGYQLIGPWKRASEVSYLIAESTEAIRQGTSPVGPIAQVPMTLILDAGGAVLRRIPRPLAPGEIYRLVGKKPR